MALPHFQTMEWHSHIFKQWNECPCSWIPVPAWIPIPGFLSIRNPTLRGGPTIEAGDIKPTAMGSVNQFYQ